MLKKLSINKNGHIYIHYIYCVNIYVTKYYIIVIKTIFQIKNSSFWYCIIRTVPKFCEFKKRKKQKKSSFSNHINIPQNYV